jgi:hypothetical protein
MIWLAGKEKLVGAGEFVDGDPTGWRHYTIEVTWEQSLWYNRLPMAVHR